MDKLEMVKLKELIKKDWIELMPGNEIMIDGKKRKITSLVFTSGPTYFFIANDNGAEEDKGCQIDLFLDNEIIDNGNYYFYGDLEVYSFGKKLKSFWGFEGFVKSICLQVNEYISYGLQNDDKFNWVRAEELEKN